MRRVSLMFIKSFNIENYLLRQKRDKVVGMPLL